VIARVNAPLDDPLPGELRQSASHSCRGTDIQEKERLGRERLLYFLRIPDFYDDVEIDERPDEGHLQSFELSHLFQCCKQLHGPSFLIEGTSYIDQIPLLWQVEMGTKLACIRRLMTLSSPQSAGRKDLSKGRTRIDASSVRGGHGNPCRMASRTSEPRV
jgi:hypothetical protein